MAKHQEKVTISEPVHSWVGRSNFARGIYHKLAEGHGAPHFHRTSSIPLGASLIGAAVHDHEEKKKKKKQNKVHSRSLENSPERDDLKSGATLRGPKAGNLGAQKSLQRVRSLERQPVSKLKKGLHDVKKSASWTHFVEMSQQHQPHLVMEVPEQWVCDMSSLFVGHKFASGNHSRLYRGCYKDQEVAVKLIRLDECEEEAIKMERQFMHEVHCLAQVHHPNIVQFVAASWKPPVCCIIMEYVPCGTLRAFLHNSEPQSIPMTDIVTIAIDIARGMEYLHSQGVVHRDLKSENLVLTADRHAKLTDFGVGCLEAECDYQNEELGTYRWMAPEMINHKHYSKKVDVYSFGIVLWELVTGDVPFEDMTPVQVAYAVVHKHARPKIPDHCPRALRNLMQQCWSFNPQKRPNFYQIVLTLEEFERSLKTSDPSFTQAWGSPTDRGSFLRCFPAFSIEGGRF